MPLDKKQFSDLVITTIEQLPEKFKAKLNNLAIFIEDYPSQEQLKKVKLRSGDGLFGLFEGYSQAKKLNFGPVLPDRITIFRQAILRHYFKPNDIRQAIISTIKHEIAHHFGSDERGAAKASREQ